MHVLPEGLLSEQRPSGRLFALSIRNVHERGRIEEHRRLHTGLRLRHVLADRSGTLPGMPEEQLHRRAASRRLQGLPDLSSWNVHLSAGRSGSRSLPRQMLARHVLGHGTRPVCPVPQELLPTAARRDHLRRMSHEHVHGQLGRGGPRGMQARSVYRQRVPTRWPLRAYGTRRALLLPGRLLRPTLRDRHRRVRVPAVLQRCHLHRPAAGVQVPMRQRLFRYQLPGGKVRLHERHVPGEGYVQERAWVQQLHLSLQIRLHRSGLRHHRESSLPRLHFPRSLRKSKRLASSPKYSRRISRLYTYTYKNFID